jgi:spermidine synthase
MGSDSDEPVVSEQHGIRYLHFDSPWIQGAMDLKSPHRLPLSYTEQMMAWLLFFEPAAPALIGQLGLGAGSLTRFCSHHLPNPLLVVERSAAVTRVCEQYFRLPRGDRLTLVHDDAARWVSDPLHWNTVSVLMVDLYDTQALGPVCGDLPFYEHCAHVLTEPGMLSVNLFGHHDSFAQNLENLNKAFDGRLVMLPPVDEGNQIVLAFKGPALSLSRQQLFERAHWVEQRWRLPAARWARSIDVTQLC